MCQQLVDGDLLLSVTVVRRAGGSSSNSDGAEKQRAFGVIGSNDLRQPQLIKQAPDLHNTYFLDNLGAFAFANLRNVGLV